MRFVLKEKRITTPFGGRTPFQFRHWAVDYSSPVGTPVYTPTNGKIIRKGWNAFGGNYIDFKDTEGYILRFMHLERYSYQLIGDDVREGEIIAYTGNTGMWVRGAHLHVEARDPNGKLINPEKYFKTMEVFMSEEEFKEIVWNVINGWYYNYMGRSGSNEEIKNHIEAIMTADPRKYALSEWINKQHHEPEFKKNWVKI